MNKASGGDGISVELFQILKDDAVKVLHSICQQFENSAIATGLEKVSFHSSLNERQCQRMLKLLHNCIHLTLMVEGSGTPLQYSCLANPMDRGAWRAAFHGVTRSRTPLSDFTFTFHLHVLEKWQPTPVF